MVFCFSSTKLTRLYKLTKIIVNFQTTSSGVDWEIRMKTCLYYICLKELFSRREGDPSARDTSNERVKDLDSSSLQAGLPWFLGNASLETGAPVLKGANENNGAFVLYLLFYAHHLFCAPSMRLTYASVTPDLARPFCKLARNLQ